MPKVFISYRRADSEMASRNICEVLKAEFGPDSIYMDVDSNSTIPHGKNFKEYLRKWVVDCDMMLLVIGPQWSSFFQRNQERGKDDPVVLEIETALESDTLVIPVLLTGAEMPLATELPASVQCIVDHQALEFTGGKRYEMDKRELIRAVRSSAHPRTPATPLPSVTPSDEVARSQDEPRRIPLPDRPARPLESISPKRTTKGRSLGRYRSAQADLLEVGQDVISLLDRGATGGTFEDQGAGLLEVIGARLDRLKAQRFQVGIVGAFNAGKTTLLNALIGRKLLPVGIRPTTAVSSHLSYGDEIVVAVEFEDSRRIEVHHTELRDYVTEKGNPENQRQVKAVHIQAPIALLEDGVELVDTPGLDSTHSHHTATTYSMVSRCDAVVLLAPARHPFGESTRLFYSEVRSYVREKVFFLLNKIDQVEPQDVEQVTRYVIEQADDPHLKLGTSAAYAALFGRRVLANDLDMSELEFDQRMSRFAHLDTAEEILTASGLPAFEAAVLTFLEEHRGLPLIRSTARDLLEMLNAADRTLQREIDALAMTREGIAEEKVRLSTLQTESFQLFEQQMNDHKEALASELDDAEVRADLTPSALTDAILTGVVITDEDLESKAAVKALLARVQTHSQSVFTHSMTRLEERMRQVVNQFRARSEQALTGLKLSLSADFDPEMAADAEVNLAAIALSDADIQTAEIGFSEFVGSAFWSGALAVVAEMIIPFGWVIAGPALALFNDHAKEQKLNKARALLTEQLRGKIEEMVPGVIANVRESVREAKEGLWAAVAEQERLINAEFDAQLSVLTREADQTEAARSARTKDLRALRGEADSLRMRLRELLHT